MTLEQGGMCDEVGLKTLLMLSENHNLKAVEEKKRSVTESLQKFKYKITAEAWKVQARNNTNSTRSINIDHNCSFPGP